MQDYHDEMLTASALKDRGWTPTLIRQFLDPPDSMKPNPRYRQAGAPMKLYRADRVESIEATSAFAEAKAKAVARSQIGKAVAQRKAAALIEAARIMPISVRAVPVDTMRWCAINAYNDRKLALRLERGHEYTPASEASDRAFLDRIMVNYIRHNLTTYDQQLEDLAGKVGIYEAIHIVRRRVYGAIAGAYPMLAEECRRQALAKTGETLDETRAPSSARGAPQEDDTL